MVLGDTAPLGRDQVRITLRIIESEEKIMNKPEDVDEDFDASDCSPALSLDVRICEGPQHVGRTGKVAFIRGQSFEVNMFLRTLVKVDFEDGTSFLADRDHLEQFDRAKDVLLRLRDWSIKERDAFSAQAKSLDNDRMFFESDQKWQKYWAFNTVCLWAEEELKKIYATN